MFEDQEGPNHSISKGCWLVFCFLFFLISAAFRRSWPPPLCNISSFASASRCPGSLSPHSLLFSDALLTLFQYESSQWGGVGAFICSCNTEQHKYFIIVLRTGAWLRFSLLSSSVGNRIHSRGFKTICELCFCLSLSSPGLSSEPHTHKPNCLPDICLFVCLFLTIHYSIWDLSSPTRDWTCASVLKVWTLNHWTTREVPWHPLFEISEPAHS